MSLPWRLLLASWAALLVVFGPSAASGAPGKAHSFDVDFPAIPRLIREPVAAPEALRLVAIRPYSAGDTLAAWRATRRRVLAVRLEVPSTWAFLRAPTDDTPHSFAPETCVPPDYRWHGVPARWGRLSPQGDDLVFEQTEASFDPRRCALGDARQSHALARPLLTLDKKPLIHAFRDDETISLLLPRGSRLATDTVIPRVYVGDFVRVDLPIKPGTSGTVLAVLPAAPAAPPAEASELEVNVGAIHLEGEAIPRVFVIVRPAAP